MSEQNIQSQVPVKWVDPNSLLPEPVEGRLLLSGNDAVPVVPLSVLREVVEGLKKSGDYTSDIYNQALDDLLASLGKVGK